MIKRLFFISFNILIFSACLFSQYKLDFDSENWVPIWKEDFNYTSWQELKNTGLYRLDDDRGRQVDYNWEDISFSNGIMILTARRFDPQFPCVPDPDLGFSCTYLDGNNIPQPFLFRSGGIVTLKQLNDGGDWNHWDDDAVCNSFTNPDQYSGIYTGLIEARIKFLAVENSWPAFWMFNGAVEIDILEGVDSFDNKFSSGFISHRDSVDYLDYPGPGLGRSCGYGSNFERDLSENFHLLSCVWIRDSQTGSHTFTYFFDGREILTETRFDGWGCPVDIRLNLAVHKETLPFEQPLHYEVDYLSVKKQLNYSTAYFYAYEPVEIGGGAILNQPAKAMAVGAGDAVFFRTAANTMGFDYITSNGSYYYHTLDNIAVSGPNPSWLVFGDVIVTTDLQKNNKVYYRGIDGKLQTYYYSSGRWNHGDIDWSPHGYGINAACGSLTGSEEHGIFARGANNQMYHFFWDPNFPGHFNNGWNVEILDEEAYKGGDNSGWRIAGDLEVSNTGSVFYRGTDGRVQRYYRSIGGWQHENIDLTANNNFLVNGDCGALAVGDGDNVFYKGNDGRLNHFFKSGSGAWVHELLPFDNYPPQLVGGDIAVASGKKVYYKGVNGELQQYTFYQDNWYHDWVKRDAEPLPVNLGTVDLGDEEKVFYLDQGKIKSYSKVIKNTGDFVDPECEKGMGESFFFRSLNNLNSDTPHAGKSLEDSIAVTFYPNPFSETLNVSMTNNAFSGSIIINDILGNEMFSSRFTNRKYIGIPTGNWPRGIYFLSLIDSGGNAIKVERVIKG